ncbi:heat shock 70 kDa protein 12A-like isoform X2 [Dysidea avara]
MNLYKTPNAKTIQATNGRALPAISVYAMTLKYLKETAIKWLDEQFRHPARKIQWIVTVPAIWSDAAKEVMRKAAEKAGLQKEFMVFAYEPEAAALFTQCDLLLGQLNVPQTHYLIVDCGGGTVDIAAQAVIKQQGQIYNAALSPPEGDNCGGFAVNDQFEKLMLNILKIPLAQFEQLKINCSVQWTKLIHEDFEASKLSLNPNDTTTPTTLEIHKKIRAEITQLTGKSMEQLIRNYNDKNVEWDDDESAIILRFNAMENLFKPVLNDINCLIKKVLEKPACRQVNQILLVGGFAESALLFRSIEKLFTVTLIGVKRSSTPIVSVVKGAALYGQHENIIKPLVERTMTNPPPPSQPTSSSDSVPQVDAAQNLANTVSTMSLTGRLPPIARNLPVVVSRKMKHSIGVETVEPFKTRSHDTRRRITHAGEAYCTKVFFALVRANEDVYVGAPKRSYNFRPLTDEQSNCIVTIFASESQAVKYIDEIGCQRKATVEITNLPTYRTNLSREIELSVNFYNTELEITAYCFSSQETKKATVSYEFL